MSWTDEVKVELFGHLMRMKPCQLLRMEVLWGCVVATGTGNTALI